MDASLQTIIDSLVPLIGVIWALRISSSFNPSGSRAARWRAAAVFCVGAVVGVGLSELYRAHQAVEAGRLSVWETLDTISNSGRVDGHLIINALKEFNGSHRVHVTRAVRLAGARRRRSGDGDTSKRSKLYRRLQTEFGVTAEELDAAAASFGGDLHAALAHGARQVAHAGVWSTLSRATRHLLEEYLELHDCDIGDEGCETSLMDKWVWQVFGLALVVLTWGEQSNYKDNFLYFLAANGLVVYESLAHISFAVTGHQPRGDGHLRPSFFTMLRVTDLMTCYLVAHHPVLHDAVFESQGKGFGDQGKGHGKWLTFLGAVALAASTWNTCWHITKIKEDLLKGMHRMNIVDAGCHSVCALAVLYISLRCGDYRTFKPMGLGLIAYAVLFQLDLIW